MWQRPIARVRERMVLGQVRPLLEVDEHVAVWAHVEAPGGDQPGLLSLTSRRCLVHWSPRPEATATFHWSELTAWELSTGSGDAAVLRMAADTQHVEVRLPLTTGARARNATDVVDHVARHAPEEATGDSSGGARPLHAVRRGWRDHARRIVVTLVGGLVVLLSAVFASPFVPGPGALTFLAGLAILAKEYDWARDAHHWTKRKLHRFLSWWRARRARRAERRAGEVHDLDAARRSSDTGTGVEPAGPDLPRAQNE